MSAEGIEFRTGVRVGVDGEVTLEDLRKSHDAVLLAIGSTRPRELPVPGRELVGIMPAMEYLKPANLALLSEPVPESLSATGRDVVILGGGDTGADCLGTALRQGAARVVQLEIMDRPPDQRPASQPWPTMPLLYKVTSAHEEGGVREYAAETVAFLGDTEGRVSALRVRDRATGVETEIPAQLVLIAAGFVGPELGGLSEELLSTNERDNLVVDDDWLTLTGSSGRSPVFACGDAVRGQSLIVWALAEGRSAAAAIDRHFSFGETTLASPVVPYLSPWG
jgi:glutamate synthase (NADPH/NADH) small chain